MKKDHEQVIQEFEDMKKIHKGEKEKLRKCWSCKITKPLTNFFRDKNRGDNREFRCKSCAALYRQKYRENNREKVREWLRQNIKKHPEYAKSRIKKLKRLGRDKVYSKYTSALKRGLIKKQPCQHCGTTDRVQGHHTDYSKPLEVIWLCSIHHKQVHMERLSV